MRQVQELLPEKVQHEEGMKVSLFDSGPAGGASIPEGCKVCTPRTRFFHEASVSHHSRNQAQEGPLEDEGLELSEEERVKKVLGGV